MRKTIVLQVRITELERRSLEVRALGTGLKVSEYCRRRLFGGVSDESEGGSFGGDEALACGVAHEPSADSEKLAAAGADGASLDQQSAPKKHEAGENKSALSAPVLAWAPKNPNFRRSPKCETGKCERFGFPCCDLCRAMNR